MRALPLSLWFGLFSAAAAVAQEDRGQPSVTRLELTAADRVPITANLYRSDEDPLTPMLVLLHDAQSSRGEYSEIAPRLTKMGFNALAVDLRVGAKCKEVKNFTAKAASLRGAVKKADALLDVMAALEYARATHAHGKLVVWGSAYSASLAFVAAASRPDLVDGVIAFAPGEYFASEGQPATWIRDSASAVKCPVFVTSDVGGEADWRPIFDALPSAAKTSFLPKAGGKHGSKALWAEAEGNEAYWEALAAFLERNFPREARSEGGAPGSKQDRER